MKESLNKIYESELKVFIITLIQSSQLFRSLGAKRKKLSELAKKELKRKLLDFSIELIKEADSGTLKNSKIHKKIEELTKINKLISFGRAQKALNIVLKSYCIITRKKQGILRELDCPLDSRTMKHCGIPENRLLDVEKNDYLCYQKKFEEEELRIFEDYKAYNENRINKFIK
ncbi:MAG: hypothetical protein LBK71_11695 [Verrucomicrobiales bacterium]|jgi:hypothetical protein|nr:hypothetical protein [Verrucomicrobiales bacterium]